MTEILVTGASGNVGRAVAERLSSADVDVRTAHRRPGDRDGGVRFDFTDADTWARAFAGVDALFLVRPPDLANVKRDLLPAVAAARGAGVRHVVFLSLQGADKNRVVPHAAVESWLRTSGMAWTFVRPSFFHQNLSTTHVSDIRDRDEIVVPAGGGATAFVDVQDVAAVAAAALLDPDRHAGRAWTVTGPRALTYRQIADILSRELDRPIRYTRPGVWHYTTARLGLAAGLTDDVRTVLGRDPVDFVAFAHRVRDAWIPQTSQEKEHR